jgi:hypothetical protein
LAERYVDGCELFAGDSQLDEDLVGDGHCSQVQLLDVGCQVSYFVDELVRNVAFVLKIQVLQSRVHNFQQIVFIDYGVGKFLSSANGTFRWRISSPSLGGL